MDTLTQFLDRASLFLGRLSLSLIFTAAYMFIIFAIWKLKP